MLAQTVLQNAMTGNVSFIEIFNEMRPSQFPSAIAFYVVTLYDDGDRGGFEHRVRVSAPGGFQWEGIVPIPEQPSPFLFVGAGPVIAPLNAEGELAIEILVDGEQAFERKYPIRKVPIATTEATTGVEDTP